MRCLLLIIYCVIMFIAGDVFASSTAAQHITNTPVTADDTNNSLSASSLETTKKPEFDYRWFAKLPVLHEGRIKPLDSFARIYLQHFYGNDKLLDRQAIAWLADTIFSPETASKQQIFRVNSDKDAVILGLRPRKPLLYSYEELSTIIDSRQSMLQDIITQNSGDKLTKNEQLLWDMYKNIADYAQIMRSLALVMPMDVALSPELAKKLDLPAIAQQQLTYLQLREYNNQLRAMLKDIVRQKGEDIINYTPQEQEIALISFALSAVELTGQNNDLLRVIPSQWEDGEQWYSPWQLLLQGQGSPQTAQLMDKWQKLIIAYQTADSGKWSTITEQLLYSSTDIGQVPDWRMTFETIYNKMALPPKILAIYGIVLVIAMLPLSVVRLSYFNVQLDLLRLSKIAFSGAILMHLAFIIARIIILQRPPVGTLYESILFVSLIAAAYGWWLSNNSSPRVGLLLGSIIGGGLLAISKIYAGKGDSMVMLMAVLNTNFWLATHVICITIGYGCALIAASLAHINLLPVAAKSTYNIKAILPFAAVVALLFTTIGTILGGIWADQSWGRFWGWDPKENGALLIVLWLIWILHGRIAGIIGTHGFSALLALTNIIVALSWFGVNLLNTGLHSYGFTDAAAYGLAVFCIVELLLVVGLYIYNKKQALSM